MDAFTHDGLQFDVIDDGPTEGAVVVLLHGYPQDASAWNGVVPHLHGAGLRTLALQQRGYSTDSRPDRVSDYRIGKLVGDVLALLDAAGVDSAHVVGHDWGGAVAWALAASHPERVASLVVLSTPHPMALRRALRRGDQARRSWYLLAYQLPWLPEQLMARFVRRGGLVRTGLPDDHARAYAERLGGARDMRGPIHWYRAALRPSGGLLGPAAGNGEISVPTTYVWGSRDPFLGRDAAEESGEHVTGDYRFVEVQTGHWLPERKPELVAEQILRRVVGESSSPD